MAVQIPSLQRTRAVEPESVGRIQAQAIDTATPFRQGMNSLISGVSQVADEFEKAKEREINTLKYSLVNELDEWAEKRLEGDSDTNTLGLRHFEGDPAPAYNQFDKELNDKYQELLKRYEGDDRTKQEIQIALDNKRNGVYGKRLNYYGFQKSKYDDRIYEEGVQVKKRSAIDAISMYSVDPTNALKVFDVEKDDVLRLRIQQGLNKGLVTEDEKGNFRYTDEAGNPKIVNVDQATLARALKDKSEINELAITSMIDTYNVDTAESMLKKYKGELDPVALTKIQEKLTKTKIEVKAYEALDKVQNLDADKARAQINKISDPMVRVKALQLKDTVDRYKQNGIERMSRESYNTLYTHVADKMRSSEPYPTSFALEDDPIFKQHADKITNPKQRQALYEMIDQPKDSDPDAVVRVMDLVVNENIYSMQPEDMQEAMVGLSKADRRRFESIYLNRLTDTDGQEGAKLSFALEELRKNMRANRLIREIDGKETKTSKEKRSQLELDVTDKIGGKLLKTMNRSDISDLMKQEVANEVIRREKEAKSNNLINRVRSFFGAKPIEEEGVIAEPVPRSTRGQRYRGGGVRTDTLITTPQTTGKAFEDISNQELADLRVKFKNEKGVSPKSIDELKAYYNQSLK